MLKMKRFAILALAVSLLFSCVPAGPDRGDIVLLPVESDPTVTMQVWFKVGAEDDPVGKEGLAYVTGQMLAEAATTKNSYEEILAKLYPMAAGYSIRVDREMTNLSGRCHKETIDDFVPLFRDAFRHPAFDEEDFTRIRSNALNYLENSLRYASDEELGKAALNEFIFEGTRYRHPVIGTVSGLKSITVEDVRNFYTTHYTAENAVPALGGGYDSAMIDGFLGSVANLSKDGEGKQAAPTVGPPKTAEIDGLEVLLVDKPDADASISFGFPIDVLRGDDDFYALWLANSWLGEHRNSASHLYQVIRAKRGLNYGDYSYIEEFPNGGRRSVPPTNVARRQQIFQVWIRTLPNDKAHFALRAAVRELKKLVDYGMTAEDFELTRSFLSKYVLHFAPTTRARLGYAVDDMFYGIDDGHLSRFRRRLETLTLEEVNAAIKKHLQYEKIKIAIVTGEAEAMKNALVNDLPSPIEYATAKPADILEEDEEIAVFPLPVSAEKVRVVSVADIFED